MKYLSSPCSCVRLVATLFLFFLFFNTRFAEAASAVEIQQWLDIHNTYRKEHQVNPVTWSNTVAASAQAFANTCPSGHSSSDYGENIGWGYPSINSVVTAWYEEEEKYDYNNPGFSYSTGHFTQVVWKKTREIGCALKLHCPGWPKTWVCQYNPPGNYIGQFEENVFPPIPDTPPPPPPPPTSPVSKNSSISAVKLLLL